ncbi:MAG: cysteine--tRNA ligase, partial [Patescibacteria group bacterium]
NYMQVEVADSDLPADIQVFLKERDEARRGKNWERADELRTLIEAAGYTVEDKDGATRVLKQ